MSDTLEHLRSELDDVNRQLLQLISRRGLIAQQIGSLKEQQGVPKFDPVREKEMLEHLVAGNEGPFDDATIRKLFKELFKASLELQQHGHKRQLLVSRSKQPVTAEHRSYSNEGLQRRWKNSYTRRNMCCQEVTRR